MADPRPELSEVRLVELARLGDSAAFDALVRRFQRAVHAVAFAVLADREAALDVLQESFIAAYRQLPTLADPTRFGPWLCAITRNQAKQSCRTRRRKGARELPLSEVTLTTPAAQPDERVARIRQALAGLTELQADSVTLFYMEGYSIRECAALLGVPEGTVKRRLHDARQRLKKELTEMVTEHLAEFALPEDYRVVIDRRSSTHSTAPTLAFFAGQWVLVWQDGLQWGPERWQADKFELWLATSADGRAWSKPRRLELTGLTYPDAASFHLKQSCVHNGRLYLQTYQHNNGIDLYSTADLATWTAHPRLRVGSAGRAGLFSSQDGLFVAYPAWVSVEGVHGDRVDLIKSADGGESWRWLNSPAWPKLGVTDAAGLVVRERIYAAWREFEEAAGAKVGRVQLSWSDDGGQSWSEPLTVAPLTLPPSYGSLSLQLASVNDKLAIIQEVPGTDINAPGEVWLAFSEDHGLTWPEKAVYSAGLLLDPAVAFTPQGSLLIAGSARSGDGSQPWLIHSRINR